MDIAIQAVLVVTVIGLLISLAVPLFGMIATLFGQVLSYLPPLLSYVAPYFSFGYGMCSRLVGNDMLLTSFLAVVIILPILYFGVEIISKVADMFVP